MPIKVNDSMIIDVEDYIKDLSPELQEKARKCQSFEELTKLAEENDIPLPDEAVESVAGGGDKMKDKCAYNPNSPYLHEWVRLAAPSDPHYPYQCSHCKICTTKPH